MTQSSTIHNHLLKSYYLIFLLAGDKVISRVIGVSSAEEVAAVLKRRPLLWDNLHANDYDAKRLFLGPYQGRPPGLAQQLAGVLSNPNCEFSANFVAIHTLAQWSRCTVDAIPSKYFVHFLNRLITEPIEFSKF